jgi:glutathione S-transferase
MKAKVYVIVGSHACRTATLMLEYKRIPYRLVELPTGLHPLLVRAAGFPGHKTPIRNVEGSTHSQLAMLDRLGTVPAMVLDGERVQANREIARHLERVCPDPPLFPLDPARRQRVEEAERWGDDVLQMAARRLLLATPAQDLRERGARGRLGPLLTRSDRLRGVLARRAGKAFRAGDRNVDELLRAISPLLDTVDGWVEEEVLCGETLTVADFTIAPSLALLSYRPDLDRELAGRPAGRLIDRLLPDPTRSPGEPVSRTSATPASALPRS